jgi:hypothetical protein
MQSKFLLELRPKQQHVSVGVLTDLIASLASLRRTEEGLLESSFQLIEQQTTLHSLVNKLARQPIFSGPRPWQRPWLHLSRDRHQSS